MTDPRLKQMRIKTGVVRRLSKEKLSYKKEAEQQVARIEKMKKEGQDEYDIMKMGLVLQESLGMIPHCHRQLVAAHDDLAEIVEGFSDVVLAVEDEEKTEEQIQYEAALEQLKQAEEQIKAEQLEDI